MSSGVGEGWREEGETAKERVGSEGRRERERWAGERERKRGFPLSMSRFRLWTIRVRQGEWGQDALFF